MKYVDVDIETSDWILDVGNSRAQRLQFYRIVDHYWNITKFMGKVLME